MGPTCTRPNLPLPCFRPKKSRNTNLYRFKEPPHYQQDGWDTSNACWNLIDQQMKFDRSTNSQLPPRTLLFCWSVYWAFTESKSDSFRACVLWYDTACSRSSWSCAWTASYPRDRVQPEKEKKRTMEFYSGKKRGKPLCCVLWVVSVNLHWPNNWHALCWLCVKQRLACWFWWILFVLDFMVFIFWHFLFQSKISQAFCTIFCDLDPPSAPKSQNIHAIAEPAMLFMSCQWPNQ